jgi:hypothetical protein
LPARANSSTRPYLEKPFTKIGLVEWLKVKALSSNPSTQNKTKQKRNLRKEWSASGRKSVKAAKVEKVDLMDCDKCSNG